MTSIFYIGVALGAVCAGIVANKYGRKASIILGVFIQFMSGILMTIATKYNLFCFIRLFYGFGFGSTLTITPIIIS
jgi:MFS family permease